MLGTSIFIFQIPGFRLACDHIQTLKNKVYLMKIYKTEIRSLTYHTFSSHLKKNLMKLN